MVLSRSRRKSLMEYIIDAIDEALPPGSPKTGREIYLEGNERFDRAHMEAVIAERRRAIERELPLISDALPEQAPRKRRPGSW